MATWRTIIGSSSSVRMYLKKPKLSHQCGPCRKRNLTTNKITKRKARLNLHQGKQVYGMNYYETYASVVTWFAIRLMIVMGIIFCWALCQVDFVMAYPQAPIETDIYMELPQGVQPAIGNSKDHMLKLLKNIYSQKQAG